MQGRRVSRSSVRPPLSWCRDVENIHFVATLVTTIELVKQNDSTGARLYPLGVEMREDSRP